MGMTSTAPRPGDPWTARRGRLALAVVVLGLASGLAACGGGTTAGGAAPTDAPGGDDVDQTAPDDSSPSTGDASESPGDTSSPLPVPSGLPGAALPADPAGADLVLVAGPPGAEQPPVTLSCDWAAGTSSGTHPAAAQACADLLAAIGAGDPFAPVGPDAMCTQQYGGDAVVQVSGAVLAADGGPVDVAATFTLTDGCEISRFDAMGAVLAPFRGTV